MPRNRIDAQNSTSKATKAVKEQKNAIDKIESRGGRAPQSEHTKLAELRTNERDLKRR